MEVAAELVVVTKRGEVYRFDPWNSTRAERESHGPIETEAIVVYKPSPVVIRLQSADGRDGFYRTVEQKLTPEGGVTRTWLCLGSSRVTIDTNCVPLIDVSS